MDPPHRPQGRIAREEAWVDAREQYEGSVGFSRSPTSSRETDLVGPDWQGLRRMLRRTIQYDAPYVHAVETRPPTGGVTVCDIDDLKYDSRKAVFLLDLIDETYPGEQFLTQLFPTAWLREMPAYPAVTNPSPESIADTFATLDVRKTTESSSTAQQNAKRSADAADIGDPFETYHAQRSRRRLALGARAAERTLYCCSYERGAGGLRRSYDESRYLQLIDATPGLELEDVDAAADAAIHGETNALEALLAQPRGELERVLQEASTGGEADLGETEALFEEIAVVLEEGRSTVNSPKRSAHSSSSPRARWSEMTETDANTDADDDANPANTANTDAATAPPSLSVDGLRTALHCPRRYEFAHVHGLEGSDDDRTVEDRVSLLRRSLRRAPKRRDGTGVTRERRPGSTLGSLERVR